MICGDRCKAFANGVVFDITDAGDEVFPGDDLGFIEAAFPDVELAFEAEGEAAFDELHGFFERHIRRGSEESVEVIRHNDEGVKLEFSLGAIVEDGLLEEIGGGGDLEEASLLGGYSSDMVGASFLRGSAHEWQDKRKVRG